MTIELIQGSAEWLQARLGKVTASRIADLMARTKTGYGASRKNYLAELVVERLTGKGAEQYVNAAMQWGTETEPQARAAYAFFTDSTVTEVGFVPHPTITMSGTSPDGYVDDDGLVEIKCPNTATHIETILTDAVPEKYTLQMQWQMACTGRKWCDFVSYDPRLPDGLSVFIRRLDRNDEVIANLETEVTKFLAELDKTITDLMAKAEKEAA
jgi:putative phage-type endonuclease